MYVRSSSIGGVLLLSVRKGSGTSKGTPLSRSANVNCVSSLYRNLNTLRQLGTFRFLPYFVESHRIVNEFPDEEVLLEGATMLTGDNGFDDANGPATRLPMVSERRGGLAAGTVSQCRAHNSMR